MAKKQIIESMEIPEGIEVELNNKTLKAKGQKGEVEKDFSKYNVDIKKENNKIFFSSSGFSRKHKNFVNSSVAHFKNMVKGVNESYIYKLKICSGHFPINIAIEKNKIVIKNFLGEKVPRYAKILDNVDVKINGDIILVESLDKEKAGQTSANIEIATKISNKDRRVFQDGCFLIDKAGVPIK